MTPVLLAERPTSLVPAPIEDTTRRRFITGAGAAALAAAFLAACGDEEESTPTPTSTPTTSTRRIKHKFGETEVPLNPQRVISVGWDEHDLILSFGVVPILQRDSWGEQPFATWPWAQAALGEAEPATFMDDMPLEQIAALEPDLIMATWAGIDEDMYGLLSAIAPTVAQHPDYDDWAAPWDVRAVQVGAVFGKEEEARAQVQAIGDRITAIRDAHPEWAGLQAVSATNPDAGQLSVDMATHSRGQLLKDFGFVLPEEIAALTEDGTFSFLSAEQINLLDRDLIVWVNGQDDPSNIVEFPLRETLAAVGEGREVYCDKVLTAAFSIQSLMSYNYLLDQLVPEIEAAVDGDPSTKVQKAVEYGLVS